MKFAAATRSCHGDTLGVEKQAPTLGRCDADEGMRMSARFVYWMNVSLDLFIEREPGDHGGVEGPDWVRIDERLHREFNARARAMSMLVEGRTIYEMMDPFWPNARGDASL